MVPPVTRSATEAGTKKLFEEALPKPVRAPRNERRDSISRTPHLLSGLPRRTSASSSASSRVRLGTASPLDKVAYLSPADSYDSVENLRTQLDDLDERAAPSGPSVQAWADRLRYTEELLDLIQEALPGMDENRDVVISMRTGMVVLEGTSPPTIYGFVTAPDSKGVGKTLIEHAVNLSHERAHGGRIQLTALNGTSLQIYEHWGFEKDAQGRRMTLDPATSSKWARVGSAWRLGAR